MEVEADTDVELVQLRHLVQELEVEVARLKIELALRSLPAAVTESVTEAVAVTADEGRSNGPLSAAEKQRRYRERKKLQAQKED